MGKCDICGREQEKLHTLKQLHLCNKHYSQYQQYGKFLDNNPRTTNDPNEIIINGNIAKIILRDAGQNIVGEAIIDVEDISKVIGYKWRLYKGGTDRSKCNGVYTGNVKKSNCISLHRFLMNCPKNMYVDHINGNRFDNRKSNLRICTNQENNFNRTAQDNNTSGSKGVWFDKSRHKWAVEIKYNNKKIYIGRYEDKNIAIFSRLYAEKLLFKDYMAEECQAILSNINLNLQVKDKLIQSVNNKLKQKALI